MGQPYTVYEITVLPTGKKYIGCTSRSIERRFSNHKENANCGRAGALYDAMREFGLHNVEVRALAVLDGREEGFRVEREVISAWGTTFPNGYNKTRGGAGVPMLPEQIASASAKKRMRRRGLAATEKQIAHWDRLKGRSLSAETIQKLSAIRRGRKQSPDWVAKRTASLKKTLAAKKAVKEGREP